MKQKNHIRRNNNKLDTLNEQSRTGLITEKSTKEYLKVLGKIYDYESDTIFKKSENKERVIRK